jgi:hypothetical protein
MGRRGATADFDNPPVYKMRGAPPRPFPVGGPRSAWRAPLLLVAVMVAWVFIAMGLAGFSGPTGGSPLAPVTLGQGVTLTPADGWASAQNVWDVGPNAVSLQHAGALVAFGADSFTGSAQELLDQQLSGVKGQLAAFRSLPTASTTLGTGIPGLKVLFSGTADSGDVEGELVVGADGATGVVMLAVAPPGQIARVQSDLDSMLGSVEVPS